MMTGTITDLRPHINLLIKGAGVQALAEFTIDTGYSGTMTLPLADCVALGLIFQGRRNSFLADGSKVRLAVYILTVVWDGSERDVEIFAVGEERLLGAAMLEDYELCLNFSANTLAIREV